MKKNSKVKILGVATLVLLGVSTISCEKDVEDSGGSGSEVELSGLKSFMSDLRVKDKSEIKSEWKEIKKEYEEKVNEIESETDSMNDELAQEYAALKQSYNKIKAEQVSKGISTKNTSDLYSVLNEFTLR